MSEAPGAPAAPRCVACGSPLVAHLDAWLLRCPQCELRVSRLGAEPVTAHTPGAWDDHNAAALAGLRAATATRLLDEIAALRPLAQTRLLDVGCGPGWFLAAAAPRCAAVAGLEPDAAMAARVCATGLAVRAGRFPEDAPRGPFDAISFNDVFEHLPAPEAALAGLAGLLSEDGLVVLSVPSRQGFFYRCAERLACLRIGAPLERMWQRGFVSPHLFYYEPATLDTLFARHGYVCVRGYDAPSLVRAGLWARITEGQRLALPLAAVIYLGCLLLLPILHRLPADIAVRIYARADAR